MDMYSYIAGSSRAEAGVVRGRGRVLVLVPNFAAVVVVVVVVLSSKC